MKTSRWEVVIVAVLCTAIGLIVGQKTAGDGGVEDDHDDHGHDHSGHDHDDEEDHSDDEAELSAATLENLGVRIAPLAPETFVRTLPVAATIVETPLTHQPLFAPIGGRVVSLEVERGSVVEPGSVVVTLTRDPLPRPKLTLTAALLEPAQERLHDNVLELRAAAEEVRISRAELERVEPFTESVDGELPVLPRQRAIELRYALTRAEKNYEKFEHELEKHGLTEDQITAVVSGAALPPFDQAAWQRALVKNGLWSDAGQALFEALPAELQSLPWATATIGELTASGLASQELAEWVAAVDVGHRFLDVGVLLLDGHSLDDVRQLHSLGALEPIVEVVAPPLVGNDAWDVMQVYAKVGAHVEAGDELVLLHDAQRLVLRAEPLGNEVAAMLDAAERDRDFTASPLVMGAAPYLGGLSVAYVDGAAGGATYAYLEVKNSVRSEAESSRGHRRRTWALREGQRFLVHIPIATTDAVYVLPVSAVTSDGPDTVIYAEDENTFLAVPVVVSYRDDTVVVIPLDGAGDLRPGARVVQSGAFELSLALQRDDAVDPHAGHNH